MDGTINIRLLIAYDGTRFLGWQKANTGSTIEGVLQAVLEKILQHPIFLQAASRTDAGVHAAGQVVNFLSKSPLDYQKLQYTLNRLLPKDIVVLEASEEHLDFHPTLDVVEKEYRYFLCYHPTQNPQTRLYSWHYPYPLDLSLMRQAAKLITGTHDFATFCNLKNKTSYPHTTRTINRIEIREEPNENLLFVICGANFLYKMVRNIVGTLVYVGCGKISGEAIPGIIGTGKRTFAGITAPAHGLSLHRILYQTESA